MAVRQADRHATGPSTLSPLLAGTLGLLALAGIAAEAAAQAGAAIDHWRHRPPLDPLALALELADGRTHWPPSGDPDPDRSRRGLRAGRELDPGAARPAAGHRRGSRGAAAGHRPQRAPGVASERQSDRRAVRRRAARAADRPRDRRRPAPVRDVGGHAVRHLGAPQRQDLKPRDPHAAGGAGRRVRDLEQARPVRRDPPGPRAARASVELRPRAARRRRARLVVEPAHLRHLRPPRARAHRRVRRRLPRPRRAA